MIGYRKFALGGLFLVFASALIVGGYLSSQDWAASVSPVMVAFMGANLTERLLEVGKQWLEKKV